MRSRQTMVFVISMVFFALCGLLPLFLTHQLGTPGRLIANNLISLLFTTGFLLTTGLGLLPFTSFSSHRSENLLVIRNYSAIPAFISAFIANIMLLTAFFCCAWLFIRYGTEYSAELAIFHTLRRVPPILVCVIAGCGAGAIANRFFRQSFFMVTLWFIPLLLMGWTILGLWTAVPLPQPVFTTDVLHGIINKQIACLFFSMLPVLCFCMMVRLLYSGTTTFWITAGYLTLGQWLQVGDPIAEHPLLRLLIHGLFPPQWTPEASLYLTMTASLLTAGVWLCMLFALLLLRLPNTEP
ncbi:MAG: hypothetical protein EOL87_16280 [Spartobacteria bacterium]|nr:hypothetical protein [Spartobacteria bacterium]